MTIRLESIPTVNTIEFSVTLLFNDRPRAALTYGQAAVLTVGFDAIGVGNSQPLSIYRQHTPTGAVEISPGSLAFVQRGPERTLELRYAPNEGVEQKVVFELE